MTDSATLLRVEGMSVRRGGRAILDGVSFTARAAEILGVIGPNGAGKTTLFEAIAGFTRRTNGSIAAQGELFYLPDGIRPWAEQRAGWCLDFFAGLFRRDRDGEAIEALQLAALLRQRVGSLSKGEARRVALAVALSTPHPILLLDEPFDGLDFRQARAAMVLLRARACASRSRPPTPALACHAPAPARGELVAENHATLPPFTSFNSRPATMKKVRRSFLLRILRMLDLQPLRFRRVGVRAAFRDDAFKVHPRDCVDQPAVVRSFDGLHLAHSRQLLELAFSRDNGSARRSRPFIHNTSSAT
jgi:ABC-2 type transport system ATP-binding protein